MLNLAEVLQLERPLAVLDLETTGLDPDTDRIVQIGLTIHYVSKPPITWCSLINPGVPIVNTTHGITDADVVDKPTFKQVGPALAPKILHVDIAGYNVTFDILFLRAEMTRAGVAWPWAGHVVDAKQIYFKKMTRHLADAYHEFGGENGQPLASREDEDWHDAANDVLATEIVLRGQLLRFPDLPRTVKELSLFCFPQQANAIDRDGKIVWHDGDACLTFGKYAKAGPVPLRKLEQKYLRWMIDNATSLSPEVKDIFRAALSGSYPVKPS